MENTQLNEKIVLHHSDTSSLMAFFKNKYFITTALLCFLFVAIFVEESIPSEYFKGILIFLLALLCVITLAIFLTSVFNRIVFAENGFIVFEYKYLKSKNEKKRISDITGFFSCAYYRNGDPGHGLYSVPAQYGLYVKWKNGNMDFFSELYASRSSLEKFVQNLKDNGVKNYSLDTLDFPLIVATSTKRIAKKRFLNPNYDYRKSLLQ